MSHEWGLLIVIYLFLGGLSGGLLAISSTATLVAETDFRRLSSTGAWLAPWPVFVGTGLLVLDLGQPFYFWKLMVAFAPASPMWIGTWLLALFLAVSVPYAATFAPAWIVGWTSSVASIWRRRLAFAGLPLGIAVGIYTGVLLGVLIARPLWNTPLVAQIFLVSALSTASALLLLVLRRGGQTHDHRLLARSDASLITLEIVLFGAMFLDAATSPSTAAVGISVLTQGIYGWLFWIGVVGLGLLLPLVLEILELTTRSGAASVHRLTAVAPAFVLAGGFVVRWVFVYAGQISRLG